MAKLSNVQLQVDSGPTIALSKVTVSFKLNFNQSDYGKKFQYAIRLRPAASANPADEDPSPPVLYRFKFGNKTTKTLTAGPITLNPFKESRNVSKEVLNEDPGSHLTQKGIVYHGDEFFASVVLMAGGGPIVAFLDEKHSPVMEIFLK